MFSGLRAPPFRKIFLTLNLDFFLQLGDDFELLRESQVHSILLIHFRFTVDSQLKIHVRFKQMENNLDVTAVLNTYLQAKYHIYAEICFQPSA